MKPQAALFAAVLSAVFNATPVLAAPPGLNLAWGDCPSTARGLVDASTACDDNNQVFELYASVAAPDGVSNLEIILATFDIQEDNPHFPQFTDWWHLEAGGCREGSLTRSFTTPASKVCSQLITQGVSSSTLDYYPNYPFPPFCRIFFTSALTSPVALNQGQEYYLVHLTLDTQHAVPIASEPDYRVCSDCRNGACIEFTWLDLSQPSGDVIVGGDSFRNFVTWQNGYGVNCFPTPVRRSTWGEVKSLYR